MAEEAYPEREQLFAIKFQRLILKANVAEELGPSACWLLMAIVNAEDETRYSRAVTFWNETLAKQCGFPNVKALDRQREKLVEAGWLTYIQGGNRKAGKYWVMVPESMNSPENTEILPVQWSNLTTEPGLKWEMNRDRTGIEVGNEPGSNRATFTPNPIPNPIPDPVEISDKPKRSAKPRSTTAFVPPTVEEVRAYCEERGNGIDPELFVSHYEAREWKFPDKNPVKNWRACVVTWEKRDGRRTRNSGGSAPELFSATGHGQQGRGFPSRNDQRIANSAAALLDFAREDDDETGVRQVDGRIGPPQAHDGVHQARIEGVVRGPPVLPVEGGEPGGDRDEPF